MLATQLLEAYRYEDCAVLCMNEGAVLVGEQIAATLHCVMMLLVSEGIEVPGEQMQFGAVSQTGNFTYNSSWSAGEINEYSSEFHGYLADQKRVAFQKINRIIGDGGTVDTDMLRHRNILVVSDGFVNGMDIDMVLDFLKPLDVQKVIAVSPVASISAIDVIHIKADAVHVLDVKSNYLDTDHYYTDNAVPTRDEAVKQISQIIMNWR